MSQLGSLPIPLDVICKYIYTSFDTIDDSCKEDIKKKELVESLLKKENVVVDEKNFVYAKVLVERCLTILFPYQSVINSCRDKHKPTYPLVRLSEQQGQAKEQNIPVFRKDEKKKKSSKK